MDQLNAALSSGRFEQLDAFARKMDSTRLIGLPALAPVKKP